MQTFAEKSQEKENFSTESTASVQRKAMTTVQRKSNGLPTQLKSGIESLSGMSMDDVTVHYNSSKPAQMKALAYTQGTDIHVGPGQEQHLGHEAWHVVQQKQGRVQPTTQLKGININDNSALEHEADVMGNKSMQLKANNFTTIQLKKSASISSSSGETMQFWGLGQHKEITKEAFKLSRRAQQRDYTKREKRSLKKGAVFNDVHGRTTIGFGAHFAFHTDEFLNESHHGGMQFLHTMSNNEDAETNKEKQMAWAKFCILTRQNAVEADANGQQIHFQNRKMLDYIRSLGENDVFFEMMMPAMLHRSKYKEFAKKYPDLRNFSPKEQAIFINHYLIMNKDSESSLANQTIEEFFQAGDWIEESFQVGNSKLDAGLIASGSLAHMLEDSFANSHAQRVINLNQADSKDTGGNLEDMLNSDDAKEKILKTQTPIMLHANYNEQQSLAIWGKHSKGDSFDKELNDTQGATQAKLAVAYVLKALDRDNIDVNDLMGFIDATLEVDKNVLALQRIQKLKETQEIVTQEEIENIIKGTDLENLNIDFLKNDIRTTKGGRQYEKTRRRFGHTSFFNGAGWMSQVRNRDVKKVLREYDVLLKKEQKNTVYTPDEKKKQLRDQTECLYRAMELSTDETKEVRQHIKEHATEMLINVLYLSKNDPDYVNLKLYLEAILNTEI